EAWASQACFRLWRPLFPALGTAAEARHGHEHVLKALGDLGIEGEPTLHESFRRNLFDVAQHLLLQLVHHGRLHRLHIREPEKLPGLEGRAIYFDVYLHDCSWLHLTVSVSPREAESRKRPKRMRRRPGPPHLPVMVNQNVRR